MFEDDSEAVKMARWVSSKDFLEYALNLDPNYQQAKELLSLVNEKIETIKKE